MPRKSSRYSRWVAIFGGCWLLILGEQAIAQPAIPHGKSAESELWKRIEAGE